MLQNIVNFVIKFKEYLTFLALVILCFAFISIGSTKQISGFRSIMIVATAWIQNSLSWIPNPAALKNENKALRDLNLQLSDEVAKLRTASVENEHLRKMLSFMDSSQISLVPAEIVGRNSIDLKSYITINKGNTAGIEIGMPVRTDAGLVGIVVGRTNNYSLIELLNNNTTRVSAEIERTGINGIFAWNGGENFTINNIPASFDVKNGDIVSTSNYSNRYPAAIPLGKVISVEKDNSSIFYKIKIKSSANLKTIEEVFVIKYIPNEERKNMIEDIERKILEGKKER
ncbi:MAG TPA: rod shape-determining protein MreC [Candidatus Kapabacteria bacterium]|nr:rod shape-determining protein MreC [Candidatus Kapabacteria bacterium]